MILDLALYGAGVASGAFGALAYVTSRVLKRALEQEAPRDKRS